jgi:ankyrin repeat protein
VKPSHVFILALASILASASCDRPPRGSEPERQLVAATTAGDLARVQSLLSEGADPNKSVDVDGRQQSAWFLALRQLRPRRAEPTAIVVAMVKAGANPRSAWGTSRTGAREPFWQVFLGPSRRGGAGFHNPLELAMANPVPAVVRALIAAGNDPRTASSALASAVEAGEVEITRMLVDAGVDVNSTAGATTPLLAAIGTRNLALMTYLEDHGARESP